MKGLLLKQQASKEEEIKQFTSCLRFAKRENDEVAIKLLNELNHKKKGFIKIIQNSREPKEIEDAVTALKKSIDDVSDFLMRQEMNLVEQVEDIIKEFERNYNELCTGTTEISQAK
jgi:ribonuclease D